MRHLTSTRRITDTGRLTATGRLPDAGRLTDLEPCPKFYTVCLTSTICLTVIGYLTETGWLTNVEHLPDTRRLTLARQDDSWQITERWQEADLGRADVEVYSQTTTGQYWKLCGSWLHLAQPRHLRNSKAVCFPGGSNQYRKLSL